MSGAETQEVCEPIAPRSSRIGLGAYCAPPALYVFVRVPNEPGRWMLTHRCVIDVACPVCKAVEGEPCFRQNQGRPPMRYWTGTHASRRQDYQRRAVAFNRAPTQHKPHLSTNDLRDAMETEP